MAKHAFISRYLTFLAVAGVGAAIPLALQHAPGRKIATPIQGPTAIPAAGSQTARAPRALASTAPARAFDPQATGSIPVDCAPKTQAELAPVPDPQAILAALAAQVAVPPAPAFPAPELATVKPESVKTDTPATATNKAAASVTPSTAPEPGTGALAAISQSVKTTPSTKAAAAPAQSVTVIARTYALVPTASTPATSVTPAIGDPSTSKPGPLIDKPEPPAFTFDYSGMPEAIAAYRKGDLAAGDAAAKKVKSETARVALEWAALRLQPRPAGFARIEKFLDAHPQWPAASWLQMRAEQGLYTDKVPAERARKWFAKYGAVSPTGQLVLARAHMAAGRKDDAKKLIAAVWRGEDFGTWLEGAILKEFSSLLSEADHHHRADRLFYKEKHKQSLAASGRAGKAFYAFAAARITVVRGADPAKAGAKLSAAQRKDPTWVFAQVHRLRKAKKYAEAGALLKTAANDPALIIVPEEWWEERRIIARNLLDAGKAAEAYELAAGHRADAGESLVGSEFYAGWLALRFLDKPETALEHFSRAMEAASTPISRARAAYWQARAAERSEHPADADRLYAVAAEHSSTYYGQLARARIGKGKVPVRAAPQVAEGSERAMAVQVVEALLACGDKELAFPLAVAIARTSTSPAQIAAAADALLRAKDARGVLVVGKLAGHRGIELDDIAFPLFGIPKFQPLPDSASPALVYAIARQESAFQAKAVSHAGARGLMQMMPATARRTAQNMKVPFDLNRLLSDPAFNAQLGAAHLGELMAEHPGSMIMVFAAYNAGGRRVREWVQAYGDPRTPGVDPIDWVERIPFSETRNYVQRITENLGVYRARMQLADVPDMAHKDLRAYAARD